MSSFWAEDSFFLMYFSFILFSISIKHKRKTIFLFPDIFDTTSIYFQNYCYIILPPI